MLSHVKNSETGQIFEHSHLQPPDSSSTLQVKKVPSLYQQCNNSELNFHRFSIQPFCIYNVFNSRKHPTQLLQGASSTSQVFRHIGIVVYTGNGNAFPEYNDPIWPIDVSLSQWITALMIDHQAHLFKLILKR